VAEPNMPDPPAADHLSLACLLLAREDNKIIGCSALPRVGECLANVRPGPYHHVDRLPWLLIESYLN
jgi:hypothetical protein